MGDVPTCMALSPTSQQITFQNLVNLIFNDLTGGKARRAGELLQQGIWQNFIA